MAHEFGVAGPVDYVASLALFERGCSLGSLEACEGIARQTARGEGCPRDEARAAKLFEELCRKGRGGACTQAAKLYFDRIGRTSDGLAVGLADQGCTLGNLEGCRVFAARCVTSETETADCATRARERACALGDHDSCESGRLPLNR
jgi:TPR repeat protein